MNRGLALLLLVLAVAPNAMAEKVYKWTDESGKIHYSNTPPNDGARARELELRIPTHEGEAEVSTASGAGRGVTLYTTSSCGYCKKAIAYLRKRSIPFTEYDVERSAAGKLDYKRLNGRGVPIILVGNQRMDGFSEPRLAEMLTKAGY